MTSAVVIFLALILALIEKPHLFKKPINIGKTALFVLIFGAAIANATKTWQDNEQQEHSYKVIDSLQDGNKQLLIINGDLEKKLDTANKRLINIDSSLKSIGLVRQTDRSGTLVIIKESEAKKKDTFNKQLLAPDIPLQGIPQPQSLKKELEIVKNPRLKIIHTPKNTTVDTFSFTISLHSVGEDEISIEYEKCLLLYAQKDGKLDYIYGAGSDILDKNSTITKSVVDGHYNFEVANKINTDSFYVFYALNCTSPWNDVRRENIKLKAIYKFNKINGKYVCSAIRNGNREYNDVLNVGMTAITSPGN